MARSLADIDEESVTWIWDGVIPVAKIAVTDGDPGQGKSLITDDVSARLTAGMPMPLRKTRRNEEIRPVNVALLCAEDDLADTVKPRLRVAGGDESRVYVETVKRRRGKIVPITLPEEIGQITDLIENAGKEGASLLIVDPVTAFLGENVKSHNDPSVRHALLPLKEEAARLNCAIWLIRHLNKDGSLKAMYRGGGSIAFNGLARSGLITGKLPDEFDGDYGLAPVKNNLRKLAGGTLAYSIVTRGKSANGKEDIPGIEWRGRVNIDADTLVNGASKPGPKPLNRSACVKAILEMFDEQDPWDSDELLAELRDAFSERTIQRARMVCNAEHGIRSFPIHKSGVVDHWITNLDRANLPDEIRDKYE